MNDYFIVENVINCLSLTSDLHFACESVYMSFKMHSSIKSALNISFSFGIFSLVFSKHIRQIQSPSLLKRFFCWSRNQHGCIDECCVSCLHTKTVHIEKTQNDGPMHIELFLSRSKPWDIYHVQLFHTHYHRIQSEYLFLSVFFGFVFSLFFSAYHTQTHNRKYSMSFKCKAIHGIHEIRFKIHCYRIILHSLNSFFFLYSFRFANKHRTALMNGENENQSVIWIFQKGFWCESHWI